MLQAKRVLVLGGGGAASGGRSCVSWGKPGAAVVADMRQDRAEEAAGELVERGGRGVTCGPMISWMPWSRHLSTRWAVLMRW
jgi:hypothetical protein